MDKSSTELKKKSTFEPSVCLEFYVPSTHKFSRVTAGYSGHLLKCTKILEHTVASILPSTTRQQRNPVQEKHHASHLNFFPFGYCELLRLTYARAILPPNPCMPVFIFSCRISPGDQTSRLVCRFSSFLPVWVRPANPS